MTAGERVPLEIIIGKPSGDREATGFVRFLRRWEWEHTGTTKAHAIDSTEMLWKVATETDFGRDYWGDTLEGWVFDPDDSSELTNALEQVVATMEKSDADAPESFEGALWRQSMSLSRQPKWIIDDVLRAGDRMIVTGETGAGKSLLLEQVAVNVAAGIHPFTGERIDGRYVLIVDPENPKDEVLDRLSTLTGLSGDAWSTEFPSLWIRTADELDLSTCEGQERLERWCWNPWGEEIDLLILGPLYRIVRGDLNEKSVADRILDCLNRIRNNGTAVILEAHSIKEGGAGPPTGTASWMQWPEVGIGITKTGKISPWRPPRRSGIILPARLERDERWDRSRWPFRPVTTESTSSTGTAGDLSSVVLDFLDRHGEKEFSRSKLGDELRSEGATFSNRALPAAIESLIEKGSITEKKIGKASILRILRNAPSSSAEDTEEPRKSVEPSSSGGASLEAPEEDGSEDGGDDLEPAEMDLAGDEDGEWMMDEDLI